MSRADDFVDVAVVVNGELHHRRVSATRTLLDMLREELDLTGTKRCCLAGECGACTVQMDGKLVDSCLVLAAEADGADVVTVEGLGRTGELTRFQQALLDGGGVQCGYCTPGQVVVGEALLAENPAPTLAEVREAFSGNLCRCGCYPQIIEALLSLTGVDGK